MIFAVIMVFAIWPMRRFAWWLCRRYLYPSGSAAFVIFNCVYWGAFVAICTRFMIVYFHPHWALKWFLGYGIGGYLANINFGLLNEASIPPEAQARHKLMSTLPFITFVVVSIALTWIPTPAMTQ
jgi:hypothetical protein